MRADKQRIVVQKLSAGGLIIGIVQTHQGIPQEGSELAASLFQFGARTWRLDHFRQIGPHLEFGVTVVVKSCRPLTSLATGKNRTRHLELPKLSSQWDQS